MHFPADKIVLVQDNLSMHCCVARRLPPLEARRLVERFEWHYTPKHGSWLDMAESEFAVLSTQCLDRRISDKTDLVAEVAAWQVRTPRRIAIQNRRPPRQARKPIPSVRLTQATSLVRK